VKNPCPGGHTLNFEKFYVFCIIKYGSEDPFSEKCPHWTNHPDSGRLLWTARYATTLLHFYISFHKSWRAIYRCTSDEWSKHT